MGGPPGCTLTFGYPLVNARTYDAAFGLLGKQYADVLPNSIIRTLLFRTTLQRSQLHPTYKYPTPYTTLTLHLAFIAP